MKTNTLSLLLMSSVLLITSCTQERKLGMQAREDDSKALEEAMAGLCKMMTKERIRQSNETLLILEKELKECEKKLKEDNNKVLEKEMAGLCKMTKEHIRQSDETLLTLEEELKECKELKKGYIFTVDIINNFIEACPEQQQDKFKELLNERRDVRTAKKMAITHDTSMMRMFNKLEEAISNLINKLKELLTEEREEAREVKISKEKSELESTKEAYDKAEKAYDKVKEEFLEFSASHKNKGSGPHRLLEDAFKNALDDELDKIENTQKKQKKKRQR